MIVNSFKCHGCGQCCRGMGAALAQAAQQPEPFRSALLAFPYVVTPEGACSQLLPSGGCGVYETRPLVCRVDDFYDAHLTAQLPRPVWHALNAALCPPAKSPGR